MKKLQNNLYITTQDTYLHKERETIIIERKKEKLLQIPIHSISGIYCFGRVLVSPILMGFCGENGVNLVFFSEYGRYLGRLQGRCSGNVLLRRAQYRKTEQSPLDVARFIVVAKIISSKGVLQRRLRNHGEHSAVQMAIKSLDITIERAKMITSLDQLRGLEGEAAANYFSVLQHLIRPEMQNEFQFTGRNRRPPLDAVNAMLSFLYSIVGQDVSSALQGVGLDPQMGFLHADRSGRDSLAQDLLEEFRAWLCDRLVFSMINRKQVHSNDFIIETSGAVRMRDEVRKALLNTLQERKQEIIKHTFLNESVEIGLLPHVQALLLARHLRGDLEYYPPFYVR